MTDRLPWWWIPASTLLDMARAALIEHGDADGLEHAMFELELAMSRPTSPQAWFELTKDDVDRARRMIDDAYEQDPEIVGEIGTVLSSEGFSQLYIDGPEEIWRNWDRLQGARKAVARKLILLGYPLEVGDTDSARPD